MGKDFIGFFLFKLSKKCEFFKININFFFRVIGICIFFKNNFVDLEIMFIIGYILVILLVVFYRVIVGKNVVE